MHYSTLFFSGGQRRIFRPAGTHYLLSDVLGKAMQQGNVASGTTVCMEALPVGVYLLTLVEPNGMRTTQRITKQ